MTQNLINDFAIKKLIGDREKQTQNQIKNKLKKLMLNELDSKLDKYLPEDETSEIETLRAKSLSLIKTEKLLPDISSRI